jgi:hypothetical protein
MDFYARSALRLGKYLFDSLGLAALQKCLAPHEAVRQKILKTKTSQFALDVGAAGRFFLR